MVTMQLHNYASMYICTGSMHVTMDIYWSFIHAYACVYIYI